MRRLALPAIALLAASRLFAGPALCEDAAPETEPTLERVHELEAQLEAQGAALNEMRAEVERYRGWMNSFALPLSDGATFKFSQKNLAPTSGLGRDEASRAAMAARLMVPGAGALHVLPTGSMRPTFAENAILLTEPARFEDLKVGDIVTYRNPSYPVPVVHRILEKRGDKFWARGDANGRMDDIYITRGNFDRRVFGIIYGSEPVQVPRGR